MRRTAAVKLFALAATTAGLIALGATAAQAADAPEPTGTSVTTNATPSPSASDNNPWD
jgi:hypothetical protein